jgi:hypothetical protein
VSDAIYSERKDHEIPRGKIDILIIINMDANVYSHVGLSFIWFVPYAFFLISFHVFFP